MIFQYTTTTYYYLHALPAVCKCPSLHYIVTLLCGTRSLMAMESRAIAGGLSADHQLPGVPNAKEVLLNKLIHNHNIDPPEIVTQ
jgi:hypothetical protein